MPRAYLRLDPGFYERKVIDQGYPAGAALALIGALCHAEYQPTRGRFRSPAILKTLLGPHAKWVQYLIDHKDLVVKKGQVYIDGWDEWQEGDWKVRERVQRIRARRSVTVDVTPGVTVGVTVGTVTHETPRPYTRRQSVIDSGGGSGGDSPQPPTSGGRRANGTSPRQVSDRDRDERRHRRTQRQLAYHRGAITEAVLDDMNVRDAPLEEIPDWAEHRAVLEADDLAGWTR